ncbi:5'-nucleotidase C-terminal domain-containing protein [Peribacillus butanolivorans]|uniref:5'-nucleotidase C-terminal domain-containing protein n=1 Tax=Peribacillus butanolivorans TaxID=421767 RepID=UPI0039FC9632
MNKKKAIKLATATAIAASAFTAVAPIQSEASTSIATQVKNAKAAMKKPFSTYFDAKKLANVTTVEKQIKSAKKEYTNVKNSIKNSSNSKAKKDAYYKELKGYEKYITRAEGYVKGYKAAEKAKKTLKSDLTKLNAAAIAQKPTDVKNKYNALDATVKKTDKNIKDTVYGAKIEKLLYAQFTAATKTALQGEIRAYYYYEKAEYWLNKGDTKTAADRIKTASKIKVDTKKDLGKAIKDYAKKVQTKYDQATDKEAPKFTYKGEVKFEVEMGENFKLPKVTAEDKLNKVYVTYKIKGPKGATKIDTNVAGVYKVTYTATDAKGNKAKDLVITVVVKEATVKVEKVSAITSKTLEVKFNTAVDDTKALFELKKEGRQVNYSKVSFSEDKKTATIELPSKITKGKYFVNVSGLVQGKVVSGSVKTEDEKVKGIEILSEKAPIEGGQVSVGYKVVNQYGEDVTKFETVEVSVKGAKEVSNTDGQLVLTKVDGANDLKAGDQIDVTLFHKATKTSATKTITVTNENFELTVMHTNDTHAHLDNIARRITAIKEVRKENKNSLLLDAGDVFSGTLYFNQYTGQADLEFMNLIGYDAMTFGNHEFDLGTEKLADFVKNAKFPFVSANVNFSNDTYLKSYFKGESTQTAKSGEIYSSIVKSIDGEKVGIFGLTTAETKDISSPGAGVEFEEYLAKSQQTVNSLEEQGVNKVIALTHLGFNDGGGDNDLTLAEKVKGIDVIVGGHSHDKLEKPTVVNTEAGAEPTVIVQANEYSNYLGQLDVEFDKDGKVIANDGKLIDLNKQNADKSYVIKDDEEALNILNTKYKPAVDDMQKFVVGIADVDLIGGNPAARTGETNLGDFIADGMLAKAQQYKPGTVIALQNGGGVRTTIKAGNITLANIFEILPFGNSLGVMDLKGSEIKSALELSVKDAPAAFGGFLQVSGLRFTYDHTKATGSRVQSVEVYKDGMFEELKDDENYQVATNIFTAKGGDGYTMFAKAYSEGRVSELGFVDWEVLQDYIKVQKDQKIAPVLEGRIIDEAKTEVKASEFNGTAEDPKTHKGSIVVDITGVSSLENALITGNLHLKGTDADKVVLKNVTVLGNTYFID